MGRSTDPIDPMMRATCAPAAVRLFVVSCWNCHHEAVLDAKRWSGATACGLGPIRAYFGVASYFSSASSRRHDENAAENGTLSDGFAGSPTMHRASRRQYCSSRRRTSILLDEAAAAGAPEVSAHLLGFLARKRADLGGIKNPALALVLLAN
jgi:hypothetical protein